MHRFTAQLALIAYLIGGWLLPAAHHHGRDHAASGGACGCHSVTWGASGWASFVEAGDGEQTTAHQHGHDHGGCCVHRCETETPDSISATSPERVAGNLIAGHCPASDCGGLCALCCTASLVNHISEEMSLDATPVVQDGKLVHVGLTWALLPLPSGLSSRGPPAV